MKTSLELENESLRDEIKVLNQILGERDANFTSFRTLNSQIVSNMQLEINNLKDQISELQTQSINSARYNLNLKTNILKQQPGFDADINKYIVNLRQKNVDLTELLLQSQIREQNLKNELDDLKQFAHNMQTNPEPKLNSSKLKQTKKKKIMNKEIGKELEEELRKRLQK
ncbi:Hypothetical_protein [Hexamita inflata]|nr:Hypothetical protein HINF_LOCUS60930 [Hexamita inflata]